MNTKALKDWTADELLTELRRRERAAANPSKGGDRARVARVPTSPRTRDLRNLSAAELAKLVMNRQRVIYGVDDRKDLYQVKKPTVKKAADAVVALVEAGDLTEQADGTFSLKTQSYQQAYQLCGNEPFVSQPLGCFCSGFLVAPDVIATAGHCVKSQADLGRMRFVFGFRMKNASTPRASFPKKDVYAGVQLIGRQLDADGTDWALVRLDRRVEHRTPVKVRTAGRVKDGQPLFVIGHPCGLPQKYAPGAQVRDNAPKPFFVANLDTYGGNSGSPVFNARNNRVEGILVRGENDFVTNGTCYVSLVCPTTGCRGEDVTRSTVWAGKVSKSSGPKTAKVTASGRAKVGARSGRRRRAARSQRGKRAR